LAHVYATAVLSASKTFRLKKLQSITNSHSGNAVMVYQLSFRWETVPLPQAASPYRRSQLVGDLPKDGPVTAWVHGQPVKHAAHDVCLLAATCQLVQTSSTLKRTELFDGRSR